MHIETARSHQTLKDGTERVYQRHLLRRSYRQGGKVRKQTLANLSHLPDEAIAALRLVLGGKTVVDADAALAVDRSAGHGHVAAVHTIARQLGLPGLLGPTVPGAGPGLRTARVAGGPATLEAVHDRLVG